MSIRVLASLLLGSALVAGGCSEHRDGIAPEEQRRDGTAGIPVPTLPDASPPEHPDDQLARLTATIPGFGGVYAHADGELTVVVVPPATADQVVPSIAPILAATGRSGSITRTVSGRYSFYTLNAWKHTLADEVLKVGPFMSLGIDDRANLVDLGVSSPAERQRILNELDRLGIPRDAVDIRVSGVPTRVHNLRSRLRPVPGGMRFADEEFDPRCTHGFNAQFPGITGDFFVTAAHCTREMGAVDGDTTFQPTRSASNRIGVEWYDKAFSASGCYPGGLCRYSDAAVIHYDDGVQSTVSGYGHYPMIAGPAVKQTDSMSTSVPRVTLISETTDAFAVNRWGIVSGWVTAGEHDNCEDRYLGTDPSGTPLYLLCQAVLASSVLAQVGDSGGPVFIWSKGSTTASLYGILWGQDDFSPYYMYASRIQQIRFDFPGIDPL